MAWSAMSKFVQAIIAFTRRLRRAIMAHLATTQDRTAGVLRLKYVLGFNNFGTSFAVSGGRGAPRDDVLLGKNHYVVCNQSVGMHETK